VGRPPRIQPAFATFHVTARGVRQQAIFLDRLDYVRHLEQLGTACERFGWVCLAWAHLTNHFHLVFRLRLDATLSTGMHWLNWSYARRFNERYGHSGHVFDRRFHAEAIERE
jgi:REP element-mobilizing transposase RayT